MNKFVFDELKPEMVSFFNANGIAWSQNKKTGKYELNLNEIDLKLLKLLLDFLKDFLLK